MDGISAALTIGFIGGVGAYCDPDYLRDIAQDYPGASWLLAGKLGFALQVSTFADENGIRLDTVAHTDERGRVRSGQTCERLLVDNCHYLVLCFENYSIMGMEEMLARAQAREIPVTLLLADYGGCSGRVGVNENVAMSVSFKGLMQVIDITGPPGDYERDYKLDRYTYQIAVPMRESNEIFPVGLHSCTGTLEQILGKIGQSERGRRIASEIAREFKNAGMERK